MNPEKEGIGRFIFICRARWTKIGLNDKVCVLCGHGGGAMTRVQKTRNVVKSLLQVWHVTRDTNSKVLPIDTRPPQNKCDAVNEFGAKPFPRISKSNKDEFGAIGNSLMNILSLKKQDNNKLCFRSNLKAVQLQIDSTKTGKTQNYVDSEFQEHNTITAVVYNPGITQWVHMVCGLWMPGTRCLNVAKMGVFDVSGATIPRKKVVCSICKRPGGLCIHCRIPKCTILFHPWCAHQKVLLQSEREGDRGDIVGFYEGACCMLNMPQITQTKLNPDVRSDYRREYLRFKQEQGWKRLVVYKSGIHALGLYTAQNILKGEMVVEYIGEIIGVHVADKQEIAYHSRGKLQYEGACYFFRIDKENIIDATRKGGIARFVNHSCSPNCAAKVISVRTQKKVVFFAERDINAGEEITYDYHFNHEDDGKKIPCFCNSRSCRRYLK